MRFRSLLAAAASWLALSAAAMADPSAPSSGSIYNLDSKWTTQDGANVALASFAGKQSSRRWATRRAGISAPRPWRT